jgi:hypothetical protein
MISQLRKLHFYDRFRFIFASSCILLGLVFWQSRPEYVPVQIPIIGETTSVSGSAKDLGTRDDLCSQLSQPDGYLLFVGTIDMSSRSFNEGFFQTANEEDGIFFEFEASSLVRLGVRLADGTTERVKFTSLRNTNAFNFLILIQGSGRIRLVGEETDEMFEIGKIAISCDDWRIGSANESSDFGGKITMSISAGSSVKNADEILDNYIKDFDSNLPSTTYKWPLYIGLLLLAFGNPFKFLQKVTKD